jgi:DNA-binding FrmR family transcriptional regulator
MPVKPGKSTNSKPAAAAAAPAGHPADPELLQRLARVEGQVRGVHRMLEEGRYCVDVLTQLAAIHEALRSVGRRIVENHMKSCVVRAARSGDPAETERVSKEMAELLDRFTR